MSDVDDAASAALGSPIFDGLTVREVAPEETDAARTVEMDITDAIRGPSRAVHGGIISTLVDYIACSTLARATGRPLATSTVNITFVNAALDGPLRASATVLRASKHQGVADVRIVDVGRDGRLVATATVVVAFLAGSAFERRG